MPRRRTIRCRHCGFMQLKRDTDCEGCGRMTARERTLWVVRGMGAVVMVGAYFIFQNVVSGIAVP